MPQQPMDEPMSKRNKKNKESQMTKQDPTDNASAVQDLEEAAIAASKSNDKKSSDEKKQQSEKKQEPETPIEILPSELQKLKNEAEEFKDKYWRLLADTENTRKRMQKERQDLHKFAVQNVILELLPSLDTFENALNCSEQSSEEVKNWSLGFKMILEQLKTMLSNHNVQPFSSEGMMFDPHHHEAVETLETQEHPDGTILQEFVRGYKMGERTIRPARVKVAKAPKEVDEEKENSKPENEQDEE